jgi:hypothetical protein
VVVVVMEGQTSPAAAAWLFRAARALPAAFAAPAEGEGPEPEDDAVR